MKRRHIDSVPIFIEEAAVKKKALHESKGEEAEAATAETAAEQTVATAALLAQTRLFGHFPDFQ